MDTETEILLGDIMEEVKWATQKYPTWPTDPLHAKAVLNEEVGELEKVILQSIYEPEKSNKDDVRKEALQVAAMSIRFLMSLNKYQYWKVFQHQQRKVAHP